MGLAEWEGAKIETLSKGMEQKLQFITTVLHEPEVLVLDEPFSGLDPVIQDVLRDTVQRARADGRTVLFSTHGMEQAERIVSEGRLFEGAERQNGRWGVELSARTDSTALLAELNGLGSRIVRFIHLEPSLHEIFVSRVGDAGTAHRNPSPASDRRDMNRTAHDREEPSHA